MVYVTMRTAVSRDGRFGRRVATPVAFAVAAAAAASLLGALLGAAGGLVLQGDARFTAASLLGAAALLLGALELRGFRFSVPQRNRETPRRWTRWHPSVAAARNGIALGVGWTTRIGFWLWFVVPLGAFLTASEMLGAAVYGSYGAARGIGPWLLISVFKLRQTKAPPRERDIGLWVIRQQNVMRIVASAQLALMGLVAIVFLPPW